jgi:AraC-like DNA-binding protein
MFRADDEPAASRLDYWHQVVGDMIAPLELRIEEGLGAPDRLLVGEVGALRVAELLASGAGGAARTPRLIRRSDPDLCKIDVVVDGHGVIEQDGRRALLGPGDFTFVDLSRPARWTMSAMRAIAVTFPRALLPLRSNDVARLTATRIGGDRAPGALVWSLARQLVGHLDDHEVDGPRLGTAVLDVVAAALAARSDRAEAAPPESRQRALLLQIQAFVEQRLGDPELSPATIAAANHISLRYLYKLFEAQQQTSVAAWVRRRRLERCRRDLVDPALADRPVSAIAARWGIPSPAHFSRVFRAEYGVAPAEYRVLSRGRS